MVRIMARLCRAPPFAGAEKALSDNQFAIECYACQCGQSGFLSSAEPCVIFLASKWVTWASNKQHLATITSVTYLVVTGPNN